MPNRLARETSTYLLQHAAESVDWYPWGEEAWARARAENKPVLLSIGYASCHWCHVMQRESFAAADIAAALNKDFVAILVDREERPDLDGLYIEALQTLTGEAGWPLTLFLTPDRKLFFGGTYFPPVNRDDLPGFGSVLDSVADEWQYNRRELQHQADGVMQQMRDRARTLPAPQPLTSDGFHKAIATIQESADPVYGGFGEAPKLPQPWLVDLMLRASARGPGGAHGIADLTLRRMARGGLYDQVGGGFHRYAVDPAWKIPHFEKMLYDNALLARVYTHASQARADATFQRVAVETLDYLLAELRAPGGAFYAGQDSDTDGVEGGYYLWSEEEFLAVEGIAPQDAAFFGVTAEGPLDGRSVLSARGDTLPDGARDRLRQARSGRTKPAVDTAILTSWNGLAIAALAEAGAAFDRPDFVAAAEAAAAFVLGRRSQDADLVHVHKGAPSPGQAEDYAYLTDGLFALWEATQDPRWIQECTSLARRMVASFGDPDGAGLFSTAAAAATGIDGLALRRKDLIDGTTPSPNGVASLLLQRLGALWGDEALTLAGVAILQAASPTVQAFPQECGSLLAALDFFLAGPREIAVVGDRSRAETQALLRQVWSRFIPNRVLAGSPPGGAAPVDSPILAGRSEVDGRPTAYVCENHLCKKPTADPAELARQLRIAGQPTPEQVDRAAEFAAFTLHRISLFDRLDNPLWIAPLLERGFFTTPPSPLEHYIPGATGSPPWPDSKYLARMAVVDPFAVHRVALQIPDTQNSLVQEDLIDAALALPPDLAVDLARRAEGWLRASPHHVMLPKKLGSLLSALAKAGHGPVALDLARSLLELLPDPLREVRAIAAEEVFPAPPQPLARFGQWDYEQILNENYPDLVHALQLPALDLLADLLDRALELSLPQEADPGSTVGAGGAAGGGVADGSYLWRPSIDENTHNVDRTLRNSLVSALREAAETIARENPGMLPILVEHLNARPWPVFRRLGLHLLRTFPEDAPGMAAAELAHHDLLDNPHFSREYVLLAHQQFNSPDSGISDAQRAQVLAWVGEGPDRARWDAVPDRWGTDPQDSDAAEGYRRQWTADRLAYLEGDGTGSDAALYAYVPRDPPVDLATPKQAEWVRTAPMEEVVRFCATWRPPTLIGAPAAGGLQRKLVEVATSEPGRFAGDTSALVDLPDDYLRALVAGLREACRQGTVFAWEPVLDLFAAVAGRKGPSARALRIGIAQCVAIGFNKSTTEIPQPLRSLVWQVLEPIATEEDHPGLPLVNASPILQRSVAAEGLQAVARYALWVRRQIETQPRGRELAKRGWEEMPEVRAVLEAHLAPDTSAQRPIEVQAFFGQWFPWLVMLDPEWAVANRDAIFPADAEGDHLRQAAWDTYLAKTPVFDQVFELLAEDYAQTVAGLAGAPEGSVGLTRPQQGLAEHLMALYLRGRIPLTPGQLPGQVPGAPGPGPGRDTLLVEFFNRAHPYQRAHALAWAGQMIQGQERIPGEILSRLMRLWEARLAAAQEAGALVGPEALAGHIEELSSFGSWFASGKFEEGWAVRQLESLLTLTGRVGTTSKVVERLKASMETMPYEVVRCIAALVASERGAITILGWGKDAQQMLSRIVGGSDARARDIALDLLDTFDLQPITDLIRWS